MITSLTNPYWQKEMDCSTNKFAHSYPVIFVFRQKIKREITGKSIQVKVRSSCYGWIRESGDKNHTSNLNW